MLKFLRKPRNPDSGIFLDDGFAGDGQDPLALIGAFEQHIRDLEKFGYDLFDLTESTQQAYCAIEYVNWLQQGGHGEYLSNIQYCKKRFAAALSGLAAVGYGQASTSLKHIEIFLEDNESQIPFHCPPLVFVFLSESGKQALDKADNEWRRNVEQLKSFDSLLVEFVKSKCAPEIIASTEYQRTLKFFSRNSVRLERRLKRRAALALEVRLTNLVEHSITQCAQQFGIGTKEGVTLFPDRIAKVDGSDCVIWTVYIDGNALAGTVTPEAAYLFRSPRETKSPMASIPTSTLVEHIKFIEEAEYAYFMIMLSEIASLNHSEINGAFAHYDVEGEKYARFLLGPTKRGFAFFQIQGDQAFAVISETGRRIAKVTTSSAVKRRLNDEKNKRC